LVLTIGDSRKTILTSANFLFMGLLLIVTLTDAGIPKSHQSYKTPDLHAIQEILIMQYRRFSLKGG
jgi:hypothetical protein